MTPEILSSKEKLQNSEILIIGGEGYIGTAIEHGLTGKTSFYSPSMNELDITNPDQIAEAIHEFQGETVMLAAGITDVAGIEKDDFLYQKALVVNYLGARDVAEICVYERKKMIFIATGYERAGSLKNPGPYVEDAPLADETGEMELLGRYARTKLLGDMAVRQAFKDHPSDLAIIFIDYPCGAVPGVGLEYQRPWYLQTLLRNQRMGRSAFADQELTITSLKDIKKAIQIIIKGDLGGVFNVAARGITAPYELLMYMMERLGEDPNQVAKGSIIEYKKKLEEEGGKVIWPIKGGFICSYTERVFSCVEPVFSFPTWQEVVDQCVEGPGGLREFWQSLVT